MQSYFYVVPGSKVYILLRDLSGCKIFDFWTLAPWPSSIQVSFVLLTHRLLTWNGPSQGLCMHKTTQTKNAETHPSCGWNLGLQWQCLRVEDICLTAGLRNMACGINSCTKFLLAPPILPYNLKVQQRLCMTNITTKWWCMWTTELCHPHCVV